MSDRSPKAPVMAQSNAKRPSMATERVRFLLKALPVLVATLALGVYLGNRFHLGMTTKRNCAWRGTTAGI